MAENRYFICGNTGSGYEHYLHVLRREDSMRVCIARGAPGTGRHRLLTALAEDWARQKRQVIRYEGAEDAGRLAAVASDNWLAFNRAAHDLWLCQGMEALAAARDCQESLARMIGDAIQPERQQALMLEALRFFA